MKGEQIEGRLDVSVVIPSYNSLDTIEDCLNSISAQVTDRKFEIIVIDSSNDGTHEIVEKFDKVKLIQIAQRTISSAARNIGVSEAKGDIICFIDSDCNADPDWIENMCSALEDGDWGAVGGAVDNACRESTVSWASYMTEFSEFIPAGQTRVLERCTSCNLALWKATYIKHGGFDEKLERYNDTEFCQRLTIRGERLLFRPDIRVRHRLRTTLDSYTRHEFKRGREAVALRRAGLLPGQSIVRFSIAGAAAAPAVLFFQMSVRLKRLWGKRIIPAGKIALTLPCFVIGSYCWAAGFIAESITPTIDITTMTMRRQLAARDEM